jgi:ATP-dependent DNA helicase PIF1
MRLQQNPMSTNSQELKDFSEWLLKVGEGKLSEPNDGNVEIDIPDEFLIKGFENSIQAIFESTYPDFFNNYNNPEYLQSRAILASTIEVVDEINEYILSLIKGNVQSNLLNTIVYLMIQCNLKFRRMFLNRGRTRIFKL